MRVAITLVMLLGMALMISHSEPSPPHLHPVYWVGVGMLAASSILATVQLWREDSR